MTTIRSLIIDDEDLVRERITQLLKDHQDFKLVMECSDGQEGVEAINIHNPDVLFIDIKMPHLNGFEVLDAVKAKDIIVVFITAYDAYALKAFDYEAFDYLVKPIRKSRFDKTISRIRKTFSDKNSDKETYVVVKVDGKVKRINTNIISHVKADDNYVTIFTRDKEYQKRSTLSQITNRLSDKGFVRIHRSFTINVSQIEDLARIYQGDYLIKMRGGRIIPTSKSYRDTVKKLLG